MNSTKEIWSVPSGSTSATRPSISTAQNTYAFMNANSSMMPLQAVMPGSGMVSSIPSNVDRAQEICKYYVNGGCLRGANCPYLHELPDERHLDVNGLGFIINPNVHNAQKTVPGPQMSLNNNAPMQVSTSSSPLSLGLNGAASSRPQFPFQQARSSSKLMPMNSPASLSTQMNSLKQPPKYRPPEPYLEHNLPPALALPLRTSTAQVAQTFTRCMLQS